MRTAYDGTIAALEALIGEPASERYLVIRKLADETWLSLEGACDELKTHRHAHLTEGRAGVLATE